MDSRIPLRNTRYSATKTAMNEMCAIHEFVNESQFSLFDSSNIIRIQWPKLTFIKYE